MRRHVGSTHVAFHSSLFARPVAGLFTRIDGIHFFKRRRCGTNEA